MNKGDLVDMVAAELGESKVDATKNVEAVFRSIAQGVASDGKVAVSGFGTFRKKHRKARKGRNPATNEEIDIPASETVSFTPSQTLKESISADGLPSMNRQAAAHHHRGHLESKDAERHHHAAHEPVQREDVRLT
jgi:DNA-binding protein HU-beta